MIGYASHTGTRRNVAGLKAAGWRVLLTPGGDTYCLGLAHACDNGAWPAYQQHLKTGAPNRLDLPAFERLIERRGATADFIVAPDIVAEGEASLALSAEWVPVLLALYPQTLILIAVQDGHEQPEPLAQICQLVRRGAGRVGLFVGGSTDWKLRTLPIWAEVKRQLRCYLHIARVNTARRIALCAAAEADSFDGTSASRFAKSLPMLEQAARQPALIGFGPERRTA